MEAVQALGAGVDGIAVLFPVRDAALEHVHVAVPKPIDVLIGQTGQVVWAGSVEDHRLVARHVCKPLRQFVQRQ